MEVCRIREERPLTTTVFQRLKSSCFSEGQAENFNLWVRGMQNKWVSLLMSES